MSIPDKQRGEDPRCQITGLASEEQPSASPLRSGLSPPWVTSGLTTKSERYTFFLLLTYGSPGTQQVGPARTLPAS